MNKKIFSHKKIGYGFFLSGGFLFSLFLSGGFIARDNEQVLNKTLHIETTKKDTDGKEYFPQTYKTAEEVKDYVKKTAIEAEKEGLVLLRNNEIGSSKALPLKKTAKVSLLGTASYRFNYNTSGSSSTSSSSYKTFPEVLKEKGVEVNESLKSLYEGELSGQGRTTNGNNYLINEPSFDLVSETLESSLQDYSDAAILTLARESGEGKDLSTYKSDGLDGSYLSLSQSEKDLLTNLTRMKKEGKVKEIIVLLNSSNPIQTDFAFEDDISVDALLWVGNVGSYGLYGVVDTLLGDSNPSGKLSDTYCRDSFSSPAMASWALNRSKSLAQYYSNYQSLNLNATQRSYEVYNEGIYLGYRYYETRYEDKVMKRAKTGEYSYHDVVSFPFGYGLSYTNFEYSNFKVSEDTDSFHVRFDVRNTGDVKGKEVAEIYLQKPYTEYDREKGIEKASVELSGYAKTKELEPGETESLALDIKKSQLKSYDADGYQTYILEEGDYYLTLSKDSHEAINNILKAKNVSLPEGETGNSGLVYKFNQTKLDKDTYSVDSKTGEKITNQFDSSDMNRYEGKGSNSIAYMSRNDWEGTWPEKPAQFSIDTDRMKEDIQSDRPIKEEDGSIMPTYSKKTDLKLIDLKSSENDEISFDDPRWDELLDSMSYEEQSKLVTSGQNATITLPSLGLPETKNLDGPTAVVETRTDSSFPSQGIWASTYNDELMEKIGDAFAEDIILSGTHGIYAPGVNLHRTPFIGRSNEYYSEDPYLTSDAAIAEIKALQKKGIICHLKHFAFNDCETNRNGVGVWLNEQEARELLLLPFERCVKEADVAAIMSSFNRIGTTWVGASKNAQIEVLKKEWGFQGYVITDMAVSNGASYMVYSDGFMNGSDLFLGSGSEKALDAYRNSPTFANRIRESSKRILYSIVNHSRAMNGIESNTKIDYIKPWYLTLVDTLTILGGVLGVLGLAYLVTNICLTKKE